MSTPVNQKGSNRISIAVAIVLTIGCAALRMQLHESDNYLFNRLLIALSLNSTPCLAPSFLCELTLSAVEVCASFMIGLKLSKVPRTIGAAQLYIVSLMAQGLFYSGFSFEAEPLSSALTVISGIAVGYVFRRLKIRDDKFESQYYEIMLRNRELQETRLLLVKQDEVERRMLAADLHDQVLNDLKALKQELDALVKDAPKESSESVQNLLGKTINEIKEVMDSLCPSTLEHLGLVASVEDCCRRASQKAGFRLRFKNTSDEKELEKLSVVERSLLYRLVQESITNISKHAAASKVQVSVASEDQALRILITDDGKGLRTDFKPGDSRGLRYMRLRADLIGAKVTWSVGEEDKGTAVEIWMDLANRNGHSHTDS